MVITHALRTPIGKFCGAFAGLSAADLGASVVSSLLASSGVAAAEVGELIFGNGRQAGGGPNVARQPDNAASPRRDNRDGWLDGETPRTPVDDLVDSQDEVPLWHPSTQLRVHKKTAKPPAYPRPAERRAA